MVSLSVCVCVCVRWVSKRISLNKFETFFLFFFLLRNEKLFKTFPTNTIDRLLLRNKYTDPLIGIGIRKKRRQQQQPNTRILLNDKKKNIFEKCVVHHTHTHIDIRISIVWHLKQTQEKKSTLSTSSSLMIVMGKWKLSK